MPGNDFDLDDVTGTPGHAEARILPGLVQALVDWLAPKHRPTRYVTVPDFRGLRVGKRFVVALAAGVKTKVVRLIEDPAPVEGVVVGQEPSPGTRVRRGTVIKLSVFHEPK